MSAADAAISREDLDRVVRVMASVYEALFRSDDRGCGCVQQAMSSVYADDPDGRLLVDAFGVLPMDRLGAELLDMNHTISALVGVLNRVQPAVKQRAIRQYLNEIGADHGHH